MHFSGAKFNETIISKQTKAKFLPLLVFFYIFHVVKIAR